MRSTVIIGMLAIVLAATACSNGKSSSKSTPAQGASPAVTSTAGQVPTTAAAGAAIGPDAVWDIGDLTTTSGKNLLTQLQNCPALGGTSREFTCVQGVMQGAGASSSAITFFKTTQWLLAGIRETGTVDVARIFDPWRANSNEEFALVNGSPAIVYVETEGNLAVNGSDPSYADVHAANPDLNLSSSQNIFEAAAQAQGDGQAFTFQYSLNNGCHGCATGYYQRVEFDFAQDGTYMGAQVLDICRSTLPNAVPADATPISGVPPCPASSQTP